MSEDIKIRVDVETDQAVSGLRSLSAASAGGRRNASALAGSLGIISYRAAAAGTAFGAVAAGLVTLGGAASSAIRGLLSLNRTILEAAASAGVLSARVGVDLLRGFGEFERKLLSMKAMAGLAGGQLDEMKEFSFALSEQTRFLADDLAAVSLEFAKAGVTGTKELQDLTTRTAQLAQAFDTIPETAGELVLLLKNQFGLAGDALEEAMQDAARVTRASTFNLESLIESLKFSGAGMATLGVKVQDLLPFMAALKNELHTAGISGRGLSAAILQVLKPSGRFHKLMKDIGLSTEDLSVSQRGLEPVLRTIADAFARSGRNIDEIFGASSTRTARVWGILIRQLREGGGTLAKLRGEVDKTGDVLGEMSRTQMSGVFGSLERLRSAWDVFLKRLGETESPLSSVADGLVVLVQNLGAAAVSSREFIQTKVGDWLADVARSMLGLEKTARLPTFREFLSGQQFREFAFEGVKAFKIIGAAMLSILDIGAGISQFFLLALENIEALAGAMLPLVRKLFPDMAKSWDNIKGASKAARGALDSYRVVVRKLRDDLEKVDPEKAARSIALVARGGIEKVAASATMRPLGQDVPFGRYGETRRITQQAGRNEIAFPDFNVVMKVEGLENLNKETQQGVEDLMRRDMQQKALKSLEVLAETNFGLGILGAG